MCGTLLIRRVQLRRKRHENTEGLSSCKWMMRMHMAATLWPRRLKQCTETAGLGEVGKAWNITLQCIQQQYLTKKRLSAAHTRCLSSTWLQDAARWPIEFHVHCHTLSQCNYASWSCCNFKPRTRHAALPTCFAAWSPQMTLQKPRSPGSQCSLGCQERCECGH